MGNSPSDRTKMRNKPFSKVGVDNFVPVIVKLSKRTRSKAAKAKRWGVIFTCLNTRVVHLELAGDLTTDSFLLSLRRFISRRGEVRIIRSDNGKNFVGAEKELKSWIRNFHQNKINCFLGHCHIEWIFNLPVIPWMGVAWESLIRSVKRALKVIVHDDSLQKNSYIHFFVKWNPY